MRCSNDLACVHRDSVKACMIVCSCLLAAVLDALEARGVLGQLRARIRAEVFSVLDDAVSGLAANLALMMCTI